MPSSCRTASGSSQGSRSPWVSSPPECKSISFRKMFYKQINRNKFNILCLCIGRRGFKAKKNKKKWWVEAMYLCWHGLVWRDKDGIAPATTVGRLQPVHHAVSSIKRSMEGSEESSCWFPGAVTFQAWTKPIACWCMKEGKSSATSCYLKTYIKTTRTL